MLKSLAIRKYGNKLIPTLQSRYGYLSRYTPSQIRTTVYKCNFNHNYLPLGYMMLLPPEQLKEVLTQEFPELCLDSFKAEINKYISEKSLPSFQEIHSL